LKIYYHTFQVPTFSATSVAYNSEIRTTAILVLLIVGGYKRYKDGGMMYVSGKFREKQSTGSNITTQGDIDT
jgi:hypothetical protein